MSTVTQPAPANGALAPVVASAFDQQMVKFVPLAESESVEITVKAVKNILAVRSKSGREPAPADIWKFMMLCKSRKLNPFTGDAYLLGYDNRDGITQWSLITAIQALRKRAEANPQFDGCQHGIMLLVDGKVVEREGALILDGEKLVGGWSICHRKDRKFPVRATVKMSVYDTGRSRWAKDPGGMISKVAEAAGLREAFPSDLAGLFIRDEFDNANDAPALEVKTVNGIAGLKNRLRAADVPPPQPTQTDDREGVDELPPDDVDQRGPETDESQEPQMSAAEAEEMELLRQAQGEVKSKRGKQSSFVEGGQQYE